jgi:16S rRNA (cytidine1402-2'-O)-methyltransferase
VEALAASLAALGERELTVGRELTKQFEEVASLRCDGFASWLAAAPQRTRGEFALVLHPLVQEESGDAEGERVLRLLLPELPLKTAVRLAAEITGGSRNALYQLALGMKEGE